MNGNLSKYVCLALFATFTATAACGGDDDGKALRNPLSPSAVGDASSMAETPMSRTLTQSVGYPMGAGGFTAPGGTAAGEQSQCTAPTTGQHWTQIAGRPRDGGVGIIRNRVEATFRGTDTLTRAGVCELAKQHLGSSGPWCGTVGHTADWEATYAMLDQLESCRGQTSVQVDPPQPQQQVERHPINGWNQGCGFTITRSSDVWEISIPEGHGRVLFGGCFSEPANRNAPDGSEWWTDTEFVEDGVKWLTVRWHDTRSVSLLYGQDSNAGGGSWGNVNDNVYTGNRRSGIMTFRGDKWRVTVVEDEPVVPSPIPVSAWGTGCKAPGTTGYSTDPLTITDDGNGRRTIHIPENGGPWNINNCYSTTGSRLQGVPGVNYVMMTHGATRKHGIHLYFDRQPDEPHGRMAFNYDRRMEDQIFSGDSYSGYEEFPDGGMYRLHIIEDEPAPYMVTGRETCTLGGKTVKVVKSFPDHYDVVIPEGGSGAGSCTFGAYDSTAPNATSTFHKDDGRARKLATIGSTFGGIAIAIASSDWANINDDDYTGPRYTPFQTIGGRRFRVVLDDDDTPLPATANVKWSNANLFLVQNRMVMEEGDNFVNAAFEIWRSQPGPVCFDMSQPGDFRFSIDGADRNGCVQVSETSDPGFQRETRLVGSHIDDNIVGRTQDYELQIDHDQSNTSYTADLSTRLLRIRVTEDDVLRFKPTSKTKTGHTNFLADVQVYGTPAPGAVFTLQLALDGPGMQDGALFDEANGKGVFVRTFGPGLPIVGGKIDIRMTGMHLDCERPGAERTTATFSAINEITAGQEADPKHLNPPQVLMLDPVVNLCR